MATTNIMQTFVLTSLHDHIMINGLTSKFQVLNLNLKIETMEDLLKLRKFLEEFAEKSWDGEMGNIEKEEKIETEPEKVHVIDLEKIRILFDLVLDTAVKTYMKSKKIKSEKKLTMQDYMVIHQSIVAWLSDVEKITPVKRKYVKLGLLGKKVKVCPACLGLVYQNFKSMKVYTEIGNF